MTALHALLRRAAALPALALVVCGDAPPGLDLARLRATCEQQLACDCEHHWDHSVDDCVDDGEIAFAEIEAMADAAGLHLDVACFMADLDDDRGCLTPSEYDALHPPVDAPEPAPGCGECQYAWGERALGEPCTRMPGARMSDCAEGLLCDGDPDGTCYDPCAVAQAGERCSFPFVDCAPGLYCDIGTWVCKAPGDIGDPCTGDPECKEGLSCHQWDDVCMPTPGLDDACQPFSRCAGGLHCTSVAPAEIVCRPLPQAGEPCGFDCAEGLVCDDLTDTCRAPRGAGEPCAEDAVCRDGLVCRDGACAAPPGAGEACHNYRCALGLACEAEVCAPETPLVCLE